MNSHSPASRLHLVCASLMALVLCACGGAEARKAKHMTKGHEFFAAGNFEKARVEFQNALQIAPKDAEARYENGLVDEKLGNPREAAQYYQGTIDVSPEHVGARTQLGRLYLFSGAPERALELIAPALQKHPDDAGLLTVRAAARLQQKDTAGAQADAERAVQLDPKNENAIAVLAGLYSNAGRLDQARTLLEQSIKSIPSTVDLRLVLAQIYASENRPAETEALLTDLVRLKPNDKVHRIRLAQYYARLNQPDAAERVLREGIRTLPAERDLKLTLVEFLAARRSREQAEKELRAMISADEKDQELKFALARFYADTGAEPKAEAVYRGVIEDQKLEPAGLTARNRLAELLARKNDIPAAKTLVNEVLNKNPRDNDALGLRGNLALATQDPKSAIADLRAVLRDQPNAVGVLRALARAHLVNGEPAIAEETMRRAIDSNPNDAALRLDFAQLLTQMGKAEQAKPVLADLVKQDPGNVSALDAQFRVAMATKDYVGARAAAEALVAIKPKGSAGYLYEGLVAEAQARTDEALRLYAAAADLQPDALEPLQAQTRLLVSLKRIPEALKRLDEVAAKNPQIPLALNMKGELLLGTQRVPEAQAAFRTAIQRAPKWWVPYRGLAYAQVAAHDADGAIATLRAAAIASDQQETVRVELAGLLERIGKPEDAIREYEDVIKRNPQSELAANNLAMLLATYRKDSASLARAASLSARFANSTNPSFLDTYGWVLYKRGETAASVPVFERVVQKSPDAPVARYHLGMAQSQAGSNVAARDNLARAVNSGAKFSGLDEAKATLEQLAKRADKPVAPQS